MVEFTSYPPGTPSWVDLSSPDVAGAKAFYGALFGWEATEGSPETGGYCMFQKQGKNVAGIGPDHERGPAAGVDDLRVGGRRRGHHGQGRRGGRHGRSWRPWTCSTRAGWRCSSTPPGRPSPCGSPLRTRVRTSPTSPGPSRGTSCRPATPSAAKSFYRAVFGWDAHTQDGPMAYTEWKRGDDTVGGMMDMPAEVPPQIPAYWLVYFAVDDCDASVAEATSSGGLCSWPPWTWSPGASPSSATPPVPSSPSSR